VKRARTSQAAAGQVRRAARLYRDFSGHDAELVDRVPAPKVPKAALVVGSCDGVLYTTKREGKVQRFIHRFTGTARPLLLVTPDGRQLLLYGGRYRFTDRGIVDRKR
jgi:hypothetical protein